MEKKIKEIIKRIKERIREEEFKEKHKISKQDFTRERKLTFELVMKFVMGLQNTSFDIEEIKFCENSNIGKISTAALCKVRDKIKYTAFQELFEETQNMIPKKEKYKGYGVIAVDGMKGELPNTPELMKKYKASKNALYPQFHTVTSFDVLNCKFIDAKFEPSPANERELAYEILEKHKGQEDIFLFDRGFPSLKLIQLINKKGLKFVARISKNFIRETNEFIKQKSLDKDIHIDYNYERVRKNKLKDVIIPYSFDLRCVKIFTPSGQTQTLITNLPRDEFKRKDIGYLYNLRWSIETSYNHLKNAIHIEDFVGKKENSIKQEFYSVLIKYNFLMLLVNYSELVSSLSKKKFKVGT